MNFLHNIPLFTIVMSFLTSVVCSIVSAKWAKRIYAVIGMIVIGLTTYLMVHTLIMGESFVYMMGHFPAPWGNEIKVGPLESSLAAIFCLILYLCVYGGFLKLKDDIRESKRNLYFSLVTWFRFPLWRCCIPTISSPPTYSSKFLPWLPAVCS